MLSAMIVLTHQTEPPRALFIRFKSVGDVVFTLSAVWQMHKEVGRTVNQNRPPEGQEQNTVGAPACYVFC
jgi:hypothetical protein